MFLSGLQLQFGALSHEALYSITTASSGLQPNTGPSYESTAVASGPSNSNLPNPSTECSCHRSSASTTPTILTPGRVSCSLFLSSTVISLKLLSGRPLSDSESSGKEDWCPSKEVTVQNPHEKTARVEKVGKEKLIRPISFPPKKMSSGPNPSHNPPRFLCRPYSSTLSEHVVLTS